MSPTQPLRVAVFGVGAVGGYFGGALARKRARHRFVPLSLLGSAVMDPRSLSCPTVRPWQQSRDPHHG